MQVAHFNIARLRALPGDPLVAEFIDNVTRVNEIAERSPGFVWRWKDETTRTEGSGDYEAVFNDPYLAASLSVWETPDDLRHFVNKTVHGAFLRRRENWFEPMDGPNYVIWPVAEGVRPTTADAKAQLEALAANGPTENAYDFSYLSSAE